MNVRASVSTVRRVITAARDQDVTFLAAGVAYYAFVSLLPATVLTIVLATVVGGPGIRSLVLAATGEFLTESGQAVIEGALQGSGRTQVTLIGSVVLLWGTLKVFRALDMAFSKVYGTADEDGFVTQLVDSILVVSGIFLGFAAMFFVGGLVVAADLALVLDVLSVVALPLVLTVAFLPIYYRFPDTDVSVREVLPGALFAAVGWTLLEGGFQLYAASAGQYEVYGVVGGVILLVTWLYIAGVLLLVGAVINVVLASERSAGGELADMDRQVQHVQDQLDAHAAMAEGNEERDPVGAPDIAELDERVRDLRADLDDFESDVERRTVDRPELEAELKSYVRTQMRKGKARGWGPYLVLAYGTVMTVSAFYLLSDTLAVVAMLVIFLSTLGLYTLFVLAGIGFNALGLPGKAVRFVKDRRD